MRHSNRAGRGRRLPVVAVGLLVILVAGCSSTVAASPPPATPMPTPVVTPDPHLTEPVSADQVFRSLGAAKLGIVANNANSGSGRRDVVKLINADIGNWPLRITEYRSTAARKKALAWKAGAAPVRNQTPYAFAGLNVVIEFGPVALDSAPKKPDAARHLLATAIAAALDPLLWPLDQHSVVTIETRALAPVASAVPSTRPTRPSKAPSPKP